MEIKNKCKYCGKSIKIRQRQYCSKECSSKAQSRQIKCICQICGIEFLAKLNVIKKGGGKFCSYVCNAQNQKENAREIRVCKLCNTEFEVYKIHKKEFCSDICRTVWAQTPERNIKMLKTLKETNIKRYGVESYYQTPEFSIKKKQTKLDKYGDENYNNMSKHKQTCFKKYGVENYAQSNEFKIIQHTKVKDKFISNLKFLNIIPLINFDTEYFGVKKNKYEFKCKICNTNFIDTIADGHVPRCKICYPILTGTSIGEKEVFQYIRQLLPNSKIIENDRKILNGKELDIYIPDKNIAIEYNGLYWHSELGGQKNKKYHLDKLNECNTKGIKLIHIFENEWLNKQNIVKSIINTILLPEINVKIFARKCELKEINSKITNQFLEDNHLQGKDKGSVRIGLYYNNELISVMTFCKSRFNKNIEWEISRYCIKLNHTVIGGAERLFKYFITNYNPNSIITYSDKRYFNGNIYKKIGFIFIESTTPNYYYTDYQSIYNRINFQKHKLRSKLKIFEQSLSEWDNMKINYWDRIWDCGNNKFIWKYKDV